MELIKIYNGSLINARELHAFLESRQKFADWIKNRIERYDFEEGKSYFLNLGNRLDGLAGKPRKEYYLTLGMAKELAMVESNKKGKEARKYFIQCEETILKLKEDKRFEAFLKLESTKEKLRQNVLDIGGDHNDFIQIDTAGRKIFFNGKLIPDEELPRILMLSRDLASEMTNEILKKETHDVNGIKQLNETHHGEVRDMLKKNIGTNPEDLPREERVKKLGE